jgi:hypothetical protein
MRRFSGVGGSFYTLGERFRFHTPLLNCGDGWDWRAPETLSYWVEEPELIIYPHGEQITVEPVECHLMTGRVGLPCNMSHWGVTATGLCQPISWLADGSRWEVNVDATVPEVTALGADHVQTAVVHVGAMTGWLRNTEVPIGEVLARFPLGEAVFTGVGDTTQMGPDTHIEFKEGVKYVPR